jgi:hypothetical protein
VTSSVDQQSGLLALIQAALPLDVLLARQSAHGANKLSDLASPGNRLGAIAPVPEIVPVTLPRPRRSSAVHPASTVWHCCLLARLPGRAAVGTGISG